MQNMKMKQVQLENRLFTDSIEYQEPLIAYTSYWCIKNGIELEDADISKVDFKQVYDMIKNDELGLYKVRLYMTKSSNGWHVFLASNQQQAKNYAYKEFGAINSTLDRTKTGMDELILVSGKSMTIRQYSKTVYELPHYIMFIGG